MISKLFRGREIRNWSAVWSSTLLTGSRVISALAVNKIIATYLGPSGLALVGQFQNFTAILFGLTSGNASNAVIATVSGACDELRRSRTISTAVAIMAIGTGIMALIIALLAQPIAGQVLQDVRLAPVLQGFAFLMVPLILNVVLLAVVAGLGRIREFVAINFGLALISVPVCWIMVRSYGIAGALLSAAVVNGAAVLATSLWLLRTRLFPIRWLWGGIDSEAAHGLIRVAAMTLSTIIAVPTAQFLVRQQVVIGFGTDAAGQWQAAIKTGEILLMGASVIVSLYLLPQFARTGAGLQRFALRSCGQMVLGLVVIGAVLVAAGEVVLPVLFSSDFDVATELLPIQVAADVIRSGVVVLQAAFLARVSMSSYVTVDLVYACVMVGVGTLTVPHDGPLGAVTAVLAASICSLCTALVLLRATTSAEAA